MSWYKNQTPEKREAIKADVKSRYWQLSPEQREARKAASRIRSAQWRIDNFEQSRDKERRNHYKRRYGITLEYYEDLYVTQEGRCAICDTWQPMLDVDHDHKTNNIRGLLCHKCNTALGQCMDSIELLDSMIKYLTPFEKLRGK